MPDILLTLRAAAGTAHNLGDKNARLNRYKLHMSDAADEIKRLRKRLVAEYRCPECGYTVADAQMHMDHHICEARGGPLMPLHR